MKDNLARFQRDLERLIKMSDRLSLSLCSDLEIIEGEAKERIEQLNLPSFKQEYEIWYSEALLVIKQILPDRLSDFIVLYKNDMKKTKDFLSYTISDYLIGLRTTKGKEVIVDGKAAVPKFEQQRHILKSVERRFQSSLFDIKQLIQADLFDDELEAADELRKKGYLRGAGAISGVVLEKHLKQVCSTHGIKIRTKNPGISDLNDLLKKEGIIEVSNWRSIQHLGDLRNVCDHDKEQKPTPDAIHDLITGVRKITKTIY